MAPFAHTMTFVDNDLAYLAELDSKLRQVTAERVNQEALGRDEQKPNATGG